MPEDRRVESGEEARRRYGLRGRLRRAREVEQLASALVAKAPDILDPRERRADVRHADLAPRRDVLDRGGAERSEVAPDDQLVGGAVRYVSAQPLRRRHEARELAVFEVRAGGLPHQAVRRVDGG